MNRIIVMVMLLATSTASAQSIKGPTPRLVKIELEHYESLRDPYTPEDNGRWYYGTALSLDLQLVSWQDWSAYYAPLLHFRSTQSQVRQGGLYYELGLDRTVGDRYIKLFRRHHSQHVFERDRGSRAYPLLDSWAASVEWRLN